MLTPDFAKQEDLDRYEAFMGGLVELIVEKYDGSLKAEHGTGVNMAPYVEREWGEKATGLMWRLKRLADPDGVLSPDVLLSRDPGVHLRDLKTTPAIEDWGGATTCVECGFCEPVCPSRNLTTTPRQRIVLRREMARQPEGSPVQQALLAEYDYDVLETCATDGSCQIACPLGIDTGRMVKELRVAQHGERAEKRALAAAKRWKAVEKASRVGLKIGGPIVRRTRRGKGLPGPAGWGGGDDPRQELLANGSPLSAWRGSSPPPMTAAVYVPSCTNRIFGGNPIGALVAVSERAGSPVWVPDDVDGSCCGLPWSSKGFAAAHSHKANEMVERLWAWSGEGALPVVIDAASCTGAIADPAEGVLSEENAERLGKLEIVDSVAWALRLLPDLELSGKVNAAAVHPTCATRRLGLTHPLRVLANALAEDVYVPPSATCCGFAGDRGISHPELTASATRPQAEELAGRSFDAHLSGNRTCEIAMTRATGEPYESVVCLLERLSR
jgi:D-lactate dehydrogenase